MAYAQMSGRLPFESASKTGHISLIEDPLVQRLIRGFQSSGSPPEPSLFSLDWYALPDAPSGIESVIACDGSCVETAQESCSLAYLRVGVQRISAPFSGPPLHPLQMQREVQRNSLCIQTVLPLEIPCLNQLEFDFRMRQAIFETCAAQPELLLTLRWLVSEAWDGGWDRQLFVQCPCCGAPVDVSRSDTARCGCGSQVFLTDLLGWSVDLAGSDSSSRVANRFMLVLEFLLLMTCIRQLWEQRPNLLPKTLFMHDGPLSIGGRYTKLIVPMRRFFRYTAAQGTPVCLCGVEKTGRFVSHLQALGMESPEQGLVFAVPSHAYVQHDIDGRALTAEHRYGERHLLGERVFVLLPEGRQLVLSVPTTLEQATIDRPVPSDLIALEKILHAIPELVTPVYDNALFPITRVNALVSIAREPCGHMLELFTEALLGTGKEAAYA